MEKNMFKLISFQHKDIIKEINEKGFYKCSRISFYNKNTPNCYKMLMDKLNIDYPPVFAWYNVLGDVPIKVDSKSLARAFEMTPFDSEDYRLFVLEVPRDKVSLQNFYNFVDMRCNEEGIDYVERSLNDIFVLKDDEEIQATLPCIKKDWVKNIYRFKDVTKEVPIDTSRYNMDYIKSCGMDIPATRKILTIETIEDITNQIGGLRKSLSFIK